MFSVRRNNINAGKRRCKLIAPFMHMTCHAVSRKYSAMYVTPSPHIKSLGSKVDRSVSQSVGQSNPHPTFPPSQITQTGSPKSSMQAPLAQFSPQITIFVTNSFLYKYQALECNINILLISLMDDTQPYRAEVRDRCVHSNFSYLHRSITVNLMMFLLTIY